MVKPKRIGRGRRPLWLRHPRAVLAAALIALTALAALGLGVEDKLEPTSLNVPGTESARANEMLQEHFGDSAPFAILLEGPTSRIDEQGPALVAALREEPGVTTVSPWDRGGGLEQLRPSNQEALVIVDFHAPIDEAVTDAVPRLDRILAERVSPPVEATSTGFATISRAIQDESVDSTRRAELIAIPILLVVLLLVFRSPVAAAIPLVFGGATVLAGRGIVSLFSEFASVDAFALTACSMMGLALGVDYALLTVSRFREELAAGATPGNAALTTRLTAGRTTIFAGSTLFISMLISVFMLPGSLLVSLAATVVIVTALAVAVASFVGPPLLVLLGDRVNLWEFGSAERRQEGIMAAVNAALRRPRGVSAVIGAGLLLLAAPALALDTGPPSTEQLPADDPARADAEHITDAIGPGWGAPFILIAETDEGTMTEPARLKALAAWQERIAAEEGVRTVIGPGQIASRVEPLSRLGRQVFGDETTPGLDELGGDLASASDGVVRLRRGLAEAGDGAGALAGGSAAAAGGAGELSAGLEQAASGATQASDALARLADGTRQLANAEQKALLGTLQLKLGLADLGSNVRSNPLPRAERLDKSLSLDFNELPQLQGPAQVAEDELEDAFAGLQGMTIGVGDPNYAATLAAVREALAAVSGTDPVTLAPYAPGYDGLPPELAALRTRLRDNAVDADEIANWLISIENALSRLRKGAIRLYDGTLQLRKASKKLAGGSAQLADAAPELAAGIGELSGGADRLDVGVSQLSGGAGTLAGGLADAFFRSRPLERGLGRADVGITAAEPDIRALRRDSPGIFDSSYFVLSALDGANPEQRDTAGQAIDLDGGQAALILAIPAYGFNSAGSVDLNDRLLADSRGLARDLDARTAVAGGAAQLTDYDRVTTTRIPIVIAAITLVTFLAMVLILRALPLAAVAVGLNLVTVAAAFGVLSALSAVPEGLPLGGHTYLDAIGAAAIFGVVFGLSIDYAVFLLMRMRESWERDGDNLVAITYGLERTAGVITGAAAIMAGVFIAFASAPIATISQMGIGLTVAVVLDATIIRLVLLPALMRMIGDRVWWLPERLDRVLPRLRT